MSRAALALCVNPMSGRDVRRLAARATNMTHEAKRDIVARVAAGAQAAGITDIYCVKEPFQIASMALAHMGLQARVHVLDLPIKNDASDTETAVAAFRDAGCDTFVSLGGDGTNRAIVRSCADMHLLPLSTGTNNVYPVLVEPTIAGMVAGLQARGLLTEPSLKSRSKVLHIQGASEPDIGLIDAVLLQDDHVGNLLPFDVDKIAKIFLTRAEPDAIGMSPIGGLLDFVEESEDAGLLIDLDPTGGKLESGGASGNGIGNVAKLSAPLSPGLFRDLTIKNVQRIGFDEPVEFSGPGVLALDGDRDHEIRTGDGVTVTLRRDGPWVIDMPAAMRWAVANGMMAQTR